MLHVDAKRIFGTVDDADGSKWDSQYDVKYKSFKQAYRHSKRDGTAFASVALPAHFSAIYSVLDLVKQRLGPEWQVERVIDWGAGTGSGLWFVMFLHTQGTIDQAIVGHQLAAFSKPVGLIWGSCP
jgi:ribosomal protein RSM22 (predicted rRNA methylase)